jgi:hypothetical protein
MFGVRRNWRKERGTGMIPTKQHLPICETCPFLLKNHGKPNPTKLKHCGENVIFNWYSTGNLRRLWNGLRTLKAPGMICHSTDPNSKDYGGKGDVKPGHERQCGGAMVLIISNMNAVSAGRPQQFLPGLTKAKIADVVWQYMTGTLPSVDDRSSEVGLPWNK